MKVKDVMTSEVYSINKGEDISKAAQIMRNAYIGILPVEDGEKVVGMITDRDITTRNVAQGHTGEIPCEEAMTAEVISCSPETPVEEAVDLMKKFQVRRLPVIENGDLIGMVALGDLATEDATDEEAGSALSNISTPSKPKDIE
ncbi:CBS domain-containing protein [Natranaerobius trueperi]|uniref:CBS domain-containing protein n=1 Tax=Natranaerobius trueperi TaxID=759412 RepID=A0A226C017_9FIRM|nr:CBS domain-containing protein [Natranaerobius trueperi]OWZ84392.1 CBS domain-containing protein [Natranaerobius trueperi]